jgi:hypothetical protein
MWRLMACNNVQIVYWSNHNCEVSYDCGNISWIYAFHASLVPKMTWLTFATNTYHNTFTNLANYLIIFHFAELLKNYSLFVSNF